MAFTMEFGTGWEVGAMLVKAGTITYTNPADNYQRLATTVRHTGAYAWLLDPIVHTHDASIRVTRPAPSNEIYISLWTRIDSTDGRVIVQNGGSTLCMLQWVPTFWRLYVGSTQVAVGTVAVSAGTWQHLQAHFVIGEAGLVETIVDGIPDITYSGNTQPGATDQITDVRLSSPSKYAKYYLDDFCFGTGGWPGDIRFDPVLVNGDVPEHCAWSPSAGADHYALVDERPPSSADYVYARADLGDRYTTPGTWDDTDGLGNVVKDPLAVVVWASARKQDGNQDDKLSLVQSDGSNEVAQAAGSLLTSYENRWYIRELAPDGGEWTTAKVNTLVIGLEADVEEVE
jgi:hypothetical protein